MLVLSFDTESNGLPQYGKQNPADGPDQPRIVGLAAGLFDDSIDNQIDGIDCIIKPDGWTIGEDTTAIHGLTNEICEERGFPIAGVLNQINELMDLADVIVGHNITHDLKMLRGELRRAGLPDRYSEEDTCCTMRGFQKARGGKLKKLGVVFEEVVGVPPENEHLAQADMMMAAHIFFAMRDELPIKKAQYERGVSAAKLTGATNAEPEADAA